MKLKNFTRALQIAFAALACISCVRETGTEEKKERISLSFSYSPQYSINTKSILTASGIEYKLSSVLVAAYLSESGKLDKSFICDGSSSDKLSLLKDTRYDLYFLANLEGLSSIQVPEDEKDIKSLQYRIPSYSSINANGIPACARIESRSFSKDTELPVDLVRLLCKVNVHISHKGITGKTQNDSKLFQNIKLYIRNANSLLSPFADGGSRAVSSSDILDVSDYDPDMAGSSTDFVFYVPENIQGQLLPYNLDPKKKNADELLSAGKDPELSTYVEFTGKLVSSGGGIGGSLLYRMYLGRDNVSDFSLERNKVYNLGLELVVDDLFNPYWKVNHGEDWSDSRVLRLLDSSGAVLPDNSSIALRVGHSATVKLFMNTDGGSGNMYRNAVKCGYMTDESEDPPVRLNWSSNVISSDQGSLSLPGRLESEGISVSMNSTTGTVTFSVKNEDDLKMTKEYEVEFFLSPGRSSHTCRVKLVVLPECRLDAGSDHLVVAQKLKLNVLNALGTYSVKVKSGDSYIDVDSQDKSVIYGKSKGTAVLQLKSSRPADDPELTVDMPVVMPQIYFIESVYDMLATMDGVPRDIEYQIRERYSGIVYLDKSFFEPQNIEKYLPATVYHEPRGDFDPDEFLDYNPYTMQLRIKKIQGVKNILDYGDENGVVDRIHTTYQGLTETVMDVLVWSPFWKYARPLGTFDLTSPLDNSSGFVHSGEIDMVAAAEATRFVFSGKMKPEIEIGERNPGFVSSDYRISFPAQEQMKYLAGDAGEQVLTAIVTNVASGEEMRHDFPVTINGYFGIGLVLEPAGPDIRDAIVRLCWKDSWREAVDKGGSLSSVNSIGDINDYFDMYVSGLKEGAEHTVKELWPEESSAMYENMTMQDAVDFMSSHNVRLQSKSGKLTGSSREYMLRFNRNVTIEKNENTKGYCRWLGCFIRDAEGGHWVDCAP